MKQTILVIEDEENISNFISTIYCNDLYLIKNIKQLNIC